MGRFECERNHAQFFTGRRQHIRQRDFGRNVAADDDSGIHGNKVNFRYIAVQPQFGLVNHPAAVCLNELHAALEFLHLAFLVRHQDALLQRSDDLHGGNALTRRDARGFLNWQGGHARHFQRARQAVIRPHHGRFSVNVAAPEQGALLPDSVPARKSR